MSMPDANTPIIGYDNLLLDGTSSGDGTNPENAYDGYTHDAWTTGAASGYLRAILGGTVNCNYYAVCGHDIYTQTGDCKMQYWTGGAYADCPGSAYTPVDNNVFVVTFPTVASTRFQFIAQNLDAAADIAVVSFGEYLQLERGVTAGYAPPQWMRRTTLYNAGTQSGAFLGRSVVRTGTAGQIVLAHCTEEWVRTDLLDFVSESEDHGWFLQWAPRDHETETAYCWTTKQPEPRYEANGFAEVTIGYEGVTS